MNPIAVTNAKYINGFQLEILFNDGKKQVVDFNGFFETHSHPQYNEYKKEENFKRFKIENGNIVWGDNWDMIFPLYDLYQGKIK